MDFTCLRLVPLIKEPHLSDSCIELLNEEWPRSTALRQKSMQKAMNSMPPLALVLLDESGALLGHARLCPLPLENRACWVESVVVWRRLRGQGLGRVLMEKVEGWAREQQFTKVFLSTTDKMDFYKKCCYSQCQPVLNFGQNSRLFEGKALNGLLNGLAHGSEAQADKSKQTNGNEARPIFVNNQIPIPPPPPPLSPQNSSFQNLGIKVGVN